MSVQESIYEHLFALTEIMKQHMMDNFDGGSLNERWTTNIFSSGTPTFTMNDNVDEGFEIDSASASSPDGGFIDFNLIRQYDHLNIVHIAEWRTLLTTAAIVASGFGGDAGLNIHRCEARFDSNASSLYGLLTSGTGSNTTTNSSITVDTNFHTFKTNIKSASATMFIAGVLEATKTDNLPSARIQPHVVMLQRGGGARQMHIRYYEAFNT